MSIGLLNLFGLMVAISFYYSNSPEGLGFVLGFLLAFDFGCIALWAHKKRKQ
jgi:hypothetical protein